MNNMLLLAAVGSLSLVIASPVLAASPFDGTWKADVTTAKLSKKPNVISIQNGVYDCRTCTPPVHVAADGAPHAVPGHDYYDAMAVTVVDAKTVHSVTSKGGQTVTDLTRTVSDDGTMMTVTATSANNANNMSLTDTSMVKRVAAGPAGSHAISGSWLPVNEGAQIADANLTQTFKSDGNTMSVSYPTGESYTATFGGPQVPLVGDKANTMVAVKRLGTDGFEETDYVGGKKVGIYTFKSVDPTTAMMRTFNVRAGRTEEVTLRKQ